LALHLRRRLVPGCFFQDADPFREALEVREEERAANHFRPLAAEPHLLRQVASGSQEGAGPALRSTLSLRRAQVVPQVVGEVGGGGVAVAQKTRQRLEADALQLSRDARIELSRRLRLAVGDAVDELGALALEGALAGEQFVEHGAE